MSIAKKWNVYPQNVGGYAPYTPVWCDLADKKQCAVPAAQAPSGDVSLVS